MPHDTRLIMGMPVSVSVADMMATDDDLEAAFNRFIEADLRFSPFRPDSELSRLNRAEISPNECSGQLLDILALAETTRIDSGGYFDIRRPDGKLDPCGIVKGWAIREAASELTRRGMHDFFVDAGGDIQAHGKNGNGQEWRVGIRNPFNADEVVKVLIPRGAGVATSGNYLRGAHIYNPHAPDETPSGVASLTVIGPDILEADRFATAAFAMGEAGIGFIERVQGLEGYQIDAQGMACMTSGLERYLS